MYECNNVWKERDKKGRMLGACVAFEQMNSTQDFHGNKNAIIEICLVVKSHVCSPSKMSRRH